MTTLIVIMNRRHKMNEKQKEIFDEILSLSSNPEKTGALFIEFQKINYDELLKSIK